MKKEHLFSSIFVVLLAMFLFASCSVDDLTGPIAKQSKVTFSIKDSLTGNSLIGDTAYVNQAILFIGQVNGITIDHWTFIWGDGSQNYNGTGGSILAVHKYSNAGTYTVTLQAWDQSNTLYEYSKYLHILDYQQQMKPIFKIVSSSQVNSNTWSYTMGFLREAVECTPRNSPFFVDTINNWVPTPLNVSDTTSDGYYKLTKQFSNNTYNAFTYGGDFNAGCYASIAPRPPRWTSAYYVNNGPQDQKLHARFHSGIAYVITGPPPPDPMPGTIGDSTNNPVMRLGLNATSDSVYIYFNKLRASGSNAPYWVNNITGMSSHQALSDIAGYPDWWYAKFSVTALPTNTALTCRYGTANGLANMSTSYFWNSMNSWLEILPSTIGDRIFLNINGRKVLLH